MVVRGLGDRDSIPILRMSLWTRLRFNRRSGLLSSVRSRREPAEGSFRC